MSASRPTGADDKQLVRGLWLLCTAAWLVHVYFSLVGWDNTLLSRFQFRQVQTAIGTLFYPTKGFSLDHELPLFGPPWSVPLEFPLYQAAVAWFSYATGMALDPAGRLVSWMFFQASLPAWWLFLGSLGFAPRHRPLFLALIVTSPIYLFFSRAFLMESTVICCAAWFLAGFCRWLNGGRLIWLVTAAFSGALAAMMKPPTMAVFGVAAGGMTLRAIWPALTSRRWSEALPLLGRSMGPFLLPLTAGLWWQMHSAGVRAANPESRILDVMFGYFSFGDLSLRLSGEFWRRTAEVWLSAILGEGGLLLALYYFVRADASLRVLMFGASAVFLSGQLIFAHLYFVHDYYFYANGVFLLIAAGIALTSLTEDASLPRWARLALPAALIALQVFSYSRTYLAPQRENTPVPELAQIIERTTNPDDMIVVLGQDWDASLPYYAKRRALMLVTARENDPAAISRSVARLDRQKVGAIVLYGHVRNDSTFAPAAFGPLDLGSLPLLLSHRLQVGVWFPRERHAMVKDRVPEHGFASMDLIVPRQTDGGVYALGRREINQMKEFAGLDPRPIRALSPSEFSTTTVAGRVVINTHAPSELIFRCPPEAARAEFSFGIHDGASVDQNAGTDGVDFSLVLRRPDGTEQVLVRRFLDPVHRPEHRGIQHAVAAIGPGSNGELCLRVGPGPSNNASFDWAYVSDFKLQRDGH